jgi:hypothetical protein
MKKLIFLTLFVVFGITQAFATPDEVINHTGCTIVVTPVCYDPATCTITSMGTSVTVPAGQTIGITNMPCPYWGYLVCWAGPGCSGTCATVAANAGPFPCPNFQPIATLPACTPCMGATVTFSTGIVEVR